MTAIHVWTYHKDRKTHEQEINEVLAARPFAQVLHMQHSVTCIDAGGEYEGGGNGTAWIYSTVLIFSS